jgi:hypothetical protein
VIRFRGKIVKTCRLWKSTHAGQKTPFSDLRALISYHFCPNCLKRTDNIDNLGSQSEFVRFASFPRRQFVTRFTQFPGRPGLTPAALSSLARGSSLRACTALLCSLKNEVIAHHPYGTLPSVARDYPPGLHEEPRSVISSCRKQVQFLDTTSVDRASKRGKGWVAG